jgi:glycerol-3-phosphate acyltransferase PlsY
VRRRGLHRGGLDHALRLARIDHGRGLIPFFLWLQKFLIQPAADIRAPLVAAVAGALLIIFAHRANIARLISGTESKFS